MHCTSDICRSWNFWRTDLKALIWGASLFFFSLSCALIFCTMAEISSSVLPSDSSERLIFIHLQCWEVWPFLTIQCQRCIKILCPKDLNLYTAGAEMAKKATPPSTGSV